MSKPTDNLRPDQPQDDSRREYPVRFTNCEELLTDDAGDRVDVVVDNMRRCIYVDASLDEWLLRDAVALGRRMEARRPRR